MYHFESDILNFDKFEIENREQTFDNHKSIKYLAQHGLYIIQKDGAHYLKCYACKKDVEILKDVEKLQLHLFHRVNCIVLNGNNLPICSQNKNKIEEFCTVEYIAQEDMIIRTLDSLMPKIAYLGFPTEFVKQILTKHWVVFGRNYDSFYELFIDIKYNANNTQISLPSRSTVPTSSDLILANHFCAVCMFRNVQVIFLPCGHLIICDICSEHITICPICRRNIERKVKKFRFTIPKV